MQSGLWVSLGLGPFAGQARSDVKMVNFLNTLFHLRCFVMRAQTCVKLSLVHHK